MFCMIPLNEDESITITKEAISDIVIQTYHTAYENIQKGTNRTPIISCVFPDPEAEEPAEEMPFEGAYVLIQFDEPEENENETTGND